VPKFQWLLKLDNYDSSGSMETKVAWVPRIKYV